MKKLSKIDESVWGGILDRGTGEINRKEYGKKVHTCIDIDIYIKDSSCQYDKYIKHILDYDNYKLPCRICIGFERISNPTYTPEDLAKMKNFEMPYDYVLDEYTKPKNEFDYLVAWFWKYNEFMDHNTNADITEDDYMSICRGIAIKLKEIGNRIEHMPGNKTNIIGQDGVSSKYSNFALKLMDEKNTFHWKHAHNGKSLLDYKEDMIHEFPELKDVDFLMWPFNQFPYVNIGLPITSVTVKDFKKYEEYTHNWFTV